LDAVPLTAIVPELTSLQRLRRVYILLNTDDGINSYDEEMLRMLEYLHTQEKMPWTYQAVLTKVDKVTSSNKLAQRVAIMRDKIVQVAPSVVSPWIVTSTAKGQHRGIDDIRQSIAEVCGFP
jgi:GTP-binding protein EngB required for normal cell division